MISSDYVRNGMRPTIDKDEIPGYDETDDSENEPPEDEGTEEE